MRLHGGFAIVKGLGYRLYPPATKSTMYSLPNFLIASLLWVFSRIPAMRELQATGLNECRALIDTMVAAAAKAKPPLAMMRHGRHRYGDDGLKGLVESATLGDPMRPLLWVSKSPDKLASALTTMGHSVGPNSVRKLRAEIAFSRQVLRKADERARHPDRASDVASQSARGIISRRPVPFGPGWFAILIGRT